VPEEQRVSTVGIVSDTHGHVENTRRAVRMLEAFAVDVVIHCGDIGAPEIVRLFAAWPTHFVLGNVDHDEDVLRQAIEEAGQTFHGRFGSIELAGRRIAFLHGDDGRRLAATTAEGKWDLVCSGHTHIASQSRQGGTLMLNPGALYRARSHTIAIVELPAVVATHVTVD